jgi:hypothetical protein
LCDIEKIIAVAPTECRWLVGRSVKVGKGRNVIGA